MSFVDKYYKKFNDSCGEYSLTISRAEFANLLGVFSKKEQQLDQLKQTIAEIKEIARAEVKYAPDGETFARPEIEKILQKISECEAQNDRT